MRDVSKAAAVALVVLGLIGVVSAGCSSDSDSSALTAVTSPTATLSTETFSGSIGPNGSAVHAFTVKSTGYTLLAGYTSLSPTVVTSLGMGIGNWDSTTSTCGLNVTQNDSARSGSTAITGTASAANYCIRVYDGGNIPAGTTVEYTLQVQHY
jgi:hypothetical protein